MSVVSKVLIALAIALPAMADLPKDPALQNREHQPTQYHILLQQKKVSETGSRIPQIEDYHKGMREKTKPAINDDSKKQSRFGDRPKICGNTSLPVDLWLKLCGGYASNELMNYHIKRLELDRKQGKDKDKEEVKVSFQMKSFEACISKGMGKGLDHGAASRNCLNRQNYRSLFYLASAVDKSCVDKALKGTGAGEVVGAVRSCADAFMTESLASIKSCKETSSQQACLRSAIASATERADAKATANVQFAESRQSIR